MEPYYTTPGCTLYCGDSRAVLPTLPAQSVDAVVTDPPYELAFMGRSWDRSGIANEVDLWRAVLRVMKPGGHLLAFGGTRTAHRMVCAIEDAGFEVRDTLCWLYGQGFPKSLDVGKALDKVAGAQRAVLGSRPIHYPDTPSGYTSVSAGGGVRPGGMFAESYGERADGRTFTAPATDLARQWDGWGTALKPAYEPIVLARAPLAAPTVAANVARWGTGALNVDGGRLAHGTDVDLTSRQVNFDRMGYHGATQTNGVATYKPAGRWPPNVALSHTLFCEPVGTRRVRASQLHQVIQRSQSASQSIGEQTDSYCSGYAAPDGTEVVEAWACHESCPVFLLDQQSGERMSALRRKDYRPPKNSAIYGDVPYRPANPGNTYGDTGGASRFFYVAKSSAAERSRGLPAGERNSHPTVKPLALMRWLLTLVVPPGGVVLDPFAGSGSTLVAAAELGITAIGIEQDAESCAIARQRLGYSTGVESGSG